jgi:tRNA pseudouridine65 synthase
VYPIHRLDAAASGCLLFATDRSVAGALAASLARGEKTYVALVRGVCGEPSHVDVRRPLRDDNGLVKAARTRLSCAGRSVDPPCSLVVARPMTGRYHQIRRHLRGLSHPIIGDRQHGDKRVNRWWREHRGVERLALHCSGISLEAPGGGRIEASCPLFEDLASGLRQLSFFDDVARTLPALGAPALPT